jgi:hypothetical protein
MPLEGTLEDVIGSRTYLKMAWGVAPWLWRVVLLPVLLAMTVAGVAKFVEIMEALGLWNAPSVV